MKHRKPYHRMSRAEKVRVSLARIRPDSELVHCPRCGVQCPPDEIEAHMSSTVRCPGPDDQAKGSGKGANSGAERIRS